MDNKNDDNKRPKNQEGRSRNRPRIVGVKSKEKRKKIHKGYTKKKAKEVCRKLEDGLGFSSRIVLIKRSALSRDGARYYIKTNAPERIAKDVMLTI